MGRRALGAGAGRLPNAGRPIIYDCSVIEPENDSLGRIVRSTGGRLARLATRRLQRAIASAGAARPDIYEQLYESHARSQGDETVVGDLALGPVEFEIVREHGLQPHHTLVDLGCGIGRLAREVIPWMAPEGSYIGIDISATMLRRAEQRLHGVDHRCSVKWKKQAGRGFALDDRSVDMICAFSVFTHIEHEDTYEFLRDGRRVIRPAGRFVFSCLPMNMADSRQIFYGSAQSEFSERWSTVRNVTTSVDLMNSISAMAGWEPQTWITGSRERFGQALCVLKPLPDEVIATRSNAWDFD